MKSLLLFLLMFSFSYSAPVSDVGYNIGFYDFENKECGYDLIMSNSNEICYSRFSDNSFNCYNVVDISDFNYIYTRGGCKTFFSIMNIEYTTFNYVFSFLGALTGFMLMFFNIFLIILIGRK